MKKDKTMKCFFCEGFPTEVWFVKSSGYKVTTCGHCGNLHMDPEKSEWLAYLHA